MDKLQWWGVAMVARGIMYMPAIDAHTHSAGGADAAEGRARVHVRCTASSLPGDEQRRFCLAEKCAAGPAGFGRTHGKAAAFNAVASRLA